MSKIDPKGVNYQEMFDLKADELSLRILICSKNSKGSESSEGPKDSEGSQGSQGFEGSKNSKDFERIDLGKQVTMITPDCLTKLPFEDQAFDLVLCPNIFFLENEQKEDEQKNENDQKDLHQKIFVDLIKIGTELRIFPLINHQGEPPKYLGSLMKDLQEQGFGIEIRQVKSPEKTNTNLSANAFLRLWKDDCEIS